MALLQLIQLCAILLLAGYILFLSLYSLSVDVIFFALLSLNLILWILRLRGKHKQE
ncbi:hypothetical protein [Halalkalibacter sp. APA_J-10(15)]|uniref:hypothetical protein n=1 Tax=unclassified Halalkalibacter TaxID=2893063 RepID=UPI001FF291AE|nr:hypothetical protein [Halalkalibacter sp. APA_J-10(15)]MCK0472627.1 hypothetical protein [Halalkalibacter sp. APA_J-10(15)]